MKVGIAILTILTIFLISSTTLTILSASEIFLSPLNDIFDSPDEIILAVNRWAESRNYAMIKDCIKRRDDRSGSAMIQ
jgi:hypothetical protein